MPDAKAPLHLLRDRRVLVLTILLPLQAILFYGFAGREYVPSYQPLASFPRTVDGWEMVQEHPLEQEVLDLLKATDTLNRSYRSPEGHPASLYMAFFATQRAGVTPHSPKVCLPGSGWLPVGNRILQVEFPGEPEPVSINRYVVARGADRSLVLYWYQTAHRVIASEYAAKLYLMLDGLRYRRSDTSIVRIVVPISETLEEKPAEELALRMARTFYRAMKQQLPGSGSGAPGRL